VERLAGGNGFDEGSQDKGSKPLVWAPPVRKPFTADQNKDKLTAIF
jgi:hypothetical protein